MSSLRRPFLALTLFSVLYVFLALMGFAPGSGGLRSAILGIREDPLWGPGDPPNELKLMLRVQDIRLQQFNITLQGRPIVCLEAPWILRSSHSQEVLILHASPQDLSIWESTLRLLSTWGHRAIAVQLPNWSSQDPSHRVPPESRPHLVSHLLSSLQFSKPAVLLAPVLGGLFALPYLQHDKNGTAGALIAISVAVPPKCRPQDFQEIKVPGLAIYTEGDPSAARVARLLTFAPRVAVRTVPAPKTAPTSAMLPNPAAVHRLVYNFLLSLRRKPNDT